MNYLIYFLSAVAFSSLVTFIINLGTRKYQMYDIPNDRSSHKIPTPRGGGLAIVIAWAVLFYISGNFSYTYFAPLIIALLGFADDLKSLPISVRLPIQIFSAIFAIITGTCLQNIYIPFIGVLNLGFIFGGLISVFFMVAFINMYNFMDGIDGLAGGGGVIFSSFLAIMAWLFNQPDIFLCCLILTGAILGFTFFNFPPAKIFMGDVGSTFLGFIFAFLSIKIFSENFQILAIVILFGTFIFDTKVTLIRRILNKEKWYLAHRTHFYQRLQPLGYSHLNITLSEYFLTIVLGIFSLLYIKMQEDIYKLLFIVISFSVLSGIAIWITNKEAK